MNINRLILAAAVSSFWLAPVFIMVILMGYSSVIVVDPLMPIVFFSSLLVSTSGVLLVGVPTHLALVRLGRTQKRYYVLIGFFASALLTFSVNMYSYVIFIRAIFHSAIIGLIGAITALIFWRVITPD